ncbi:MAG: HAD family hydrolase [Candidatus Aenigmarchaeota archaeon]|nr:HAD family hydrolase [Candidatus Aenigmarchaeota archaeon]
MAYQGIVSDWNGTLFKPPTDEGLNKTIAYAALGHAVNGLKHGQVWKAADVARLALTKGQLEKMVRRYEAGEIPINDVYDLFNRRVLSDMPILVFSRAIYKYARSHRSDLDDNVLMPVSTAAQAGKETGILSVSYSGSIIHILGLDRLRLFGKIVAHGIVGSGSKVIGFNTDIYGRKAEVLEDRFFREGNLRPETTLYIGDSGEDEPVASVLPQGNFIVPFLATDDFKEKMASKHNAFVPKNREELQDFLRTK